MKFDLEPETIHICTEHKFRIIHSTMYNASKDKEVPAIILNNESYPMVCFDMSEPDAEQSIIDWIDNNDLKQRQFRLSNEDYEYLKGVGKGNATSGLRNLIKEDRSNR